MRLPGGGMSWKEFFVGLKDEILHDGIPDLAATVTYYGILSLFPFLLMLVAIASFVITPEQAESIVDRLGEVAPGPATQILGERIREIGGRQHATLLGVGALFAVWSASGGVMALVTALNRCYDVKEQRPWWKVRSTAIGMTIVAGGLALVAAIVAIAAGPLAGPLGLIGGPIGTAISWLRLPIAGLIVMFLWALLYHVLPDVDRKFKFLTPGSIAGVLLWVAASWGFSRYVSSFGSYSKTYGTLGGVIVLLLWMWISTLVLLLGAEVDALIERRSRKPVLETRVAPPAPAPARSRGPLRGIVAVAAGLAAGLLLARRSA
jgi:membrane protein